MLEESESIDDISKQCFFVALIKKVFFLSSLLVHSLLFCPWSFKIHTLDVLLLRWFCERHLDELFNLDGTLTHKMHFSFRVPAWWWPKTGYYVRNRISLIFLGTKLGLPIPCKPKLPVETAETERSWLALAAFRTEPLRCVEGIDRKTCFAFKL